MKVYLCALLALCMLFPRAQTISILKGEEFEHSKKLRYSYPVEGDENARYFLECSAPWFDGKCMLYKVALNNAKVSFSIEIIYEKKQEFIAAYNKHGKIMVFTKLLDRKADEMHLLLREFNNKTGAEIGEAKKVSQLSLKDERNFERGFTISFSPDNSKMLIVAEERGKKTAPEVTARLYDCPGFKNIWEKKAVVVYENSPVYTFNYLVGNDGVFTYLFAFYRSNSEADIGYGVGLISANNFQNRMIRIPDQNRSIYSPVLEFVENTLVCSGEFFEGRGITKKDKEIKDMGFFFVTEDLNSSEVSSQSFNILSDEIKAKLNYHDKNTYYAVSGITANSYAKKAYRHYQTLRFNGSFYVIKHHSYILLINGVPTTTNKEILVMKYNGEKQLEWMRMIPRQTYVMGVIANQLNLVCTSKLNFLYYEHPKNQNAGIAAYDPKTYKLLTAPDKKSLVLTSLAESGEVQKQVVPTESTFNIPEEFEKNFSREETRFMGTGDTDSKKMRRYDVIQVKD